MDSISSSDVGRARLCTLAAGLTVAGLLLCLPRTLDAQTPGREPAANTSPPPLTYHGLVPGVSTLAEVRAKLGEPAHAAFWYAYKLLYPADGEPGRSPGRAREGRPRDQLGYMVPGYDFDGSTYEEGMSVGPAVAPLVREQAERMILEHYQPGRFRLRAGESPKEGE